MKHFEDYRSQLCGMNSHYRFYQLETFFASLAKQNIHYAELWCGPMHFYVDDTRHGDVENLLRLQKRYDVKLIGLCPEQTNPKPNNIATLDRIEEVYHYYEQMMLVANKLSITQILVTSGWAYLDEEKEAAWNRSIQMMKRLTHLAQQHQIKLVMEALQVEESVLVNTVHDLQSYLNEVQHPALEVCIDFGAMARANDSIAAYFQAFSGKIAHVHFVDGDPTGHLAWGDGKRNLREDIEWLATYDYQGYLSLETAASRYYQKPWESERKTVNAWKRGGYV